jgi:predicted Ser/Thr protein kinase
MPRPLRSTDPVRLGGYEVTARLGEGGQGVVYLGCAADGRPVAIKVLRAELDDDRARRWFLRELRAARRVGSSWTAQIVDVVIGDDVFFLVTDYIAGPSLREAVKREGPVSGGRLERLAIAMAAALVAIHRAGVVHRDFKPGNVLLGPQGPRVIDFGIARLLDTAGSSNSQIMGTPPFMAPEQFRGERAGPAADVFAWGCTVVYAATGHSPFDGGYIPAIINRVLNDDPDLGVLDGPLREVVTACLHKNPRRRPTSHQLLAWLHGDEAARPSPPMPVSHPEKPSPAGLDLKAPNVARIYDYLLDGKDNFAADREAAEKVIALMPGSREGARANRAFLVRAVRYLVEQAGIRQFLDLGSGLPTQGNVHEIALSSDPKARVVYVDYDPMVCVHSRALVPSIENVGVVEADLRQPEAVIDHPETRRLLDFSEPVAVMMVSILHFVADEYDPPEIVARYRDWCVPGSYMVISHLTGDLLLRARPEETKQVEEIYQRTSAPVYLRTHDEIRRLYAGYELEDPGLVWLTDWHPDIAPPAHVPEASGPPGHRARPVEEAPGYGGKIPGYAGVARKS